MINMLSRNVIINHFIFNFPRCHLFQEVDFSPLPFDITNKRLSLVDFSYPFGNDKFTILSAKKMHEDTNDLNYFKQVDFSVWIAVVMTFVLIIIQNIVVNKSFLSNFADNLFCAFRMMIRAGQ